MKLVQQKQLPGISQFRARIGLPSQQVRQHGGGLCVAKETLALSIALLQCTSGESDISGK